MKIPVRITISLKEGILDPEARAIQHALADLGFPTEKLSNARLFYVTIDAPGEEEALSRARQMCDRLLANPVIHRYTVEVNR
ncbi:MAG: phosphoribosylformylglycinamidine synthase subunit PurS [Methanomicrobiales archaeon]|nr:phosphoribosylformylglycinamidine synthase subunit PurS [Methanomicrobiales archaeon]